MVSVVKRAARLAALVTALAIFVGPVTWADEPTVPPDPPQVRLQPPGGVATQVRLQPPVGLADLLWLWIRAQIGVPIE
jgi:hypothetical protein